MTELSKFKCKKCGTVIQIELDRVAEFIKLKNRVKEEISRGQGIKTREYGLSFGKLLSSLVRCCATPDYILMGTKWKQ